MLNQKLWQRRNAWRKVIKKLLTEHKATAQRCVEEYKRLRDKSTANYRRIKELEDDVTPEAMQECLHLKSSFTAVVDADYQMSKLLPHWGYSAQPGRSY